MPLLDTEGNQLAPVRGYNLSVDGFIAFLNSGLKKIAVALNVL